LNLPSFRIQDASSENFGILKIALVNPTSYERAATHFI